MKKIMMMVAACMLSIVSVAQTTESLSIVDFEITAGETKSVAVELKSGTEYTNFKFDILLPDGLTIALNSRGKLDVSLSEDMVDDHFLTAQKVSETENRYRFIAISMTNAVFLETSGILLNLTIQADVTVPAGQLVGKIQGVNFSTPAAVDSFFDDTTFIITCKENPATGINDPMADKGEKPIYTLDGRRTKTMQKGVNIVNGQKVVVK